MIDPLNSIVKLADDVKMLLICNFVICICELLPEIEITMSVKGIAYIFAFPDQTDFPSDIVLILQMCI